MRKLAALALSASFAFVACAVGTTETTDPGGGDDGGTSGQDSPSHADAAHAADAGTTPDTSADPDSSTTTDAGATDAAGADSGPTTIPCDPPSPCSGATSIGTVSGDTTSADVTTSGSTSKWLRIDVTENDSGITGVPMKLAVALTSPAGANFDLYVYLGSGLGNVECTTVAKSSVSTSSTDSVSLTWGEMGLFSNGIDDGKTVTIEVRAVSTPCDPNATWSLNVHGH